MGKQGRGSEGGTWGGKGKTKSGFGKERKGGEDEKGEVREPKMRR